MNKKKKETNQINKYSKPKKTAVKRSGKLRNIIVFAALGIIVAFLIFAIISTGGRDDESFFKKLDRIKTEEQPYMVLIRDDFTPAGQENTSIAKKIAHEAEKYIVVFDIGYEKGNPSREALYFIDDNDVKSLPVVLIFDQTGKLVNSYSLPLDSSDIIDDVKAIAERSGADEEN